MNSGNLYPLVDDMLNSRRVALEKINAMFGTEITVDFASAWTMRATETGDVENPVEDVDNVSRETDLDTPPDAADEPQDTPPDAADEPQDTPQDEPQDEPSPADEPPQDEQEEREDETV